MVGFDAAVVNSVEYLLFVVVCFWVLLNCTVLPMWLLLFTGCCFLDCVVYVLCGLVVVVGCCVVCFECVILVAV